MKVESESCSRPWDWDIFDELDGGEVFDEDLFEDEVDTCAKEPRRNKE